MSTQHTPGPWTVIAPNWSEHVITAEGCEIACLSIEGTVTEETQDALSKTQGANARLIAAAPELLKAAQLTALHFKRSDASGNFLGDDEHEAWSALEAAISKATAQPAHP